MNRCYFLILLLFLNFGCGAQIPSKALTAFDQNGIIGGTSVANGEIPFIVNIWLNSPKDNYNSHHCGGSLIDPKWVLTAAHCLVEDKSESSIGPIDPKSITLFFSSLNADGSGGILKKVKRIIIHPQFSWPNYDIALIELTERIDGIPTVTLASSPALLPKEATVAGWGLTDSEGLVDAKTLFKVTLTLADRDLCNQDFFPKKRGWLISADMICAFTQNNQKASCPGDSGGPLFSLIDGHFMQFGVISWGTACRKTFGESAQSNIEVYANVAQAYVWINKTISN